MCDYGATGGQYANDHRYPADHGASYAHAKRDVGTSTSYELTEVRTVLSRAETALECLCRRQRGGRDQFTADPDQDTDKMIDDLAVAVKALRKWERTGRSRKR